MQRLYNGAFVLIDVSTAIIPNPPLLPPARGGD
jgi:hypothetical protein